jgi:hypothetical protein
MKNEIIALMHDISTNESGFYSGLFGFDGFKIKKTINIFWAFKNTETLYSDIKLFMDYLIFMILSEYSTTTNIPNTIKLNNIIINNCFAKTGLLINDIENSIFCDFENVELEVTAVGDLNMIDIKLPIYDLN